MVFKRSKSSDSITFVLGDDRKSVRLKSGKTILDLALENDVPLAHSCTVGTCGSCRVIVLEGLLALKPRGDIEIETAAERGFSENERLACLNEGCSGLEVRVPNAPKS